MQSTVVPPNPPNLEHNTRKIKNRKYVLKSKIRHGIISWSQEKHQIMYILEQLSTLGGSALANHIKINSKKND